MPKSPAFQFYPEEFLVGTALFSFEEKGIYITLLSYQWAHGHIPGSDDKLRKLLGISPRRFSAVLSKFTRDEKGDLYNERLDRERLKQEDYREKQKANGLLGGRPKRTQALSDEKPNANPGPNPNDNPEANPKKALQS